MLQKRSTSRSPAPTWGHVATPGASRAAISRSPTPGRYDCFRRGHICCRSSQDSTSTASLLDNDRVVSALTSVGLSGSLAVVGAQLANLCGAHIDLWQGFHSLQGLDWEITVRIGGLLLLYEFLLLGIPWYSGLLDKGELSSGKSVSASAVDVAQVLQRVEEDAVEGTSRGSALTNSASRLAAPPSARVSADPIPASPSTSTDAQSSSQTRDASQRSPFSMQLASPAMQEAMTGTSISFPLLRATLAMQQACFVATGMVRSDIPPAVDAGLVFLRESSKELLQRGLFVTFFATWLADRCFEAGADDVVALAGAVPLYTTDACRWVMATIASLLLLPPVMADASTMGLSAATNFALMATKMGDEPTDDKEVQEYRLYEAMQRTVRGLPARLTTALHEVRGIMRFTAINAVFAATNNMSASLTVAVLSNLLLLVYSTAGREGLKLKRPSRPPQGRPGSRPPKRLP